jgi:hypothetical protein
MPVPLPTASPSPTRYGIIKTPAQRNILPQFSFQKNNFLQDEMLDVGDYAVPAFADIGWGWGSMICSSAIMPDQDMPVQHSLL